MVCQVRIRGEGGVEGRKGWRGEMGIRWGLNRGCVMSCHVMSCHVMAVHVMSVHVMSTRLLRRVRWVCYVMLRGCVMSCL